MIQIEKELLLKDLCARLPYGVIIRLKSNDANNPFKDEVLSTLNLFIDSIEIVKPYLRPMSSMTMEDEKEYCRLVQDTDNGIEPITNLMDWLNAHHLDYHGLIEKGLAIEAPKGMYKEE